MPPLHGKLIVLTREEVEGAKENDAWETYLAAQGATVYRFPTIRTVVVESTPELLKFFNTLVNFDWIIFTSANGVRYTKLFTEQSGVKLPTAEVMPRIAVVGAQTAAAVNDAGYQVAFISPVATGDALATSLEPVNGKKVLLLRSTISQGEIVAKLQSRGAIVTDVAAYRTEQVLELDQRMIDMITRGAINFTTFASPSAVKGFCARINNAEALAMAKKISAAAIGPTTRDALIAEGFLDVRMAKEANIEALSDVMI